jgi:hypothetical protein
MHACICRNRDLWDTSRMLYQLSYEIKSVRVGDISELSLFPSISMYLEYVHIEGTNRYIANSNRLDLRVAQLVEHWTGGTFQFARCGCTLRPRLHYIGLHRSVAIFIPDSAAVYTTPAVIRYATRSKNHSALEVI